MGLVAGFQAAPDRVMGHAGAFVAPGEGDARSKYRALQNAGVVMTNHPAKFGPAMKQLLHVNAPVSSRYVRVSLFYR